MIFSDIVLEKKGASVACGGDELQGLDGEAPHLCFLALIASTLSGCRCCPDEEHDPQDNGPRLHDTNDIHGTSCALWG